MPARSGSDGYSFLAARVVFQAEFANGCAARRSLKRHLQPWGLPSCGCAPLFPMRQVVSGGTLDGRNVLFCWTTTSTRADRGELISATIEACCAPTKI